ncbi:MAG: HAD family hydrolase [Adlercreutzia equolifaciens]
MFDVDGTLLDTLDDLVVLTNDALAEFNLPPRTREEINSYVGNGVKALMYQAVPEGTPQDVADACLARWKENYGTYPNNLTKPYPGIPALLAELRRRGCKLGVLSNKFDGGVQFIMNKCLPMLWMCSTGRRPAELPAQARPGGAAHHH